MAKREREKAKRPAARASEGTQGMSEAMQRLEARAKVLELERDGLKSELEAARARIAMLEESRKKVANRIDWVIDSLHNLAEKDT
jgi:predicted RNase H-like nuclease (RuvC/YqgF family)